MISMTGMPEGCCFRRIAARIPPCLCIGGGVSSVISGRLIGMGCEGCEKELRRKECCAFFVLFWFALVEGGDVREGRCKK